MGARMTDDPNTRYHRYLAQVFALLSRPGPWQFGQTDPDQGPSAEWLRHYLDRYEYTRDRDDEQPELRCPVCGHRGCPLDVRGKWDERGRL